MVKIYCIEDCNGLKYVGSTIQTLNKRLYHHRSHNECKSNDLDLYNSKIYTLEECEEKQRKVREQYWIDNTKCVNKCNTIKKKSKKEYDKIYREKNKLKRKQYQDYTASWAGDPRYNNNLLKIDLDIFL